MTANPTQAQSSTASSGPSTPTDPAARIAWLEGIKGRLAAATPGPWEWKGNTSGKSLWLASLTPMTPTVMDFVRWGMGAACPRFNIDGIMERADGMFVRPQSHNPWLVRGIDHPDAAFIAAARTDVPALVAEVEHLTSENARLTALANRLGDAMQQPVSLTEAAPRMAGLLRATLAKDGHTANCEPGHCTGFCIEARAILDGIEARP